MAWQKDQGRYAKQVADEALRQTERVEGILDEAQQSVESVESAVRKANEDTAAIVESTRKVKDDTEAVRKETAAIKAATESAATRADERGKFAETQGNRAKAEADRLEGTDVSVLDNKIKNVTTQLADKASKSQLETTDSRINNLIAHAGETDGNSELLDMRVGFDGTTYATAGDSLRAIGSFLIEEGQKWEVN